MKYLLVALLLLAQAPEPEVYPGSRNHAEPPADFICHRPPVDLTGDQAQWCSCERMKREDGTIAADKTCTVYCWEDRYCGCGMTGEKRSMPSEPPK